MPTSFLLLYVANARHEYFAKQNTRATAHLVIKYGIIICDETGKRKK